MELENPDCVGKDSAPLEDNTTNNKNPNVIKEENITDDKKPFVIKEEATTSNKKPLVIKEEGISDDVNPFVIKEEIIIDSVLDYELNSPYEQEDEHSVTTPAQAEAQVKLEESTTQDSPVPDDSKISRPNTSELAMQQDFDRDVKPFAFVHCEQFSGDTLIPGHQDNRKIPDSSSSTPTSAKGKALKRTTSAERSSAKNYYECVKCSKLYLSEKSLSRHIKNKPNCSVDLSSKRWRCTVCRKVSRDKSSLVKHLRTHSAGVPFVCNQCPESFKHKSELTLHIRAHMNIEELNKKHMSVIADKITKSEGSNRVNVAASGKLRSSGESLPVHIEDDVDEPNVPKDDKEGHPTCTICGRVFFDKLVLASHFLTHSGDEPFSCIVCSRPFSRQSNLTCHLLTHSGADSFSCCVCSRKYSGKADLLSHLRTHARGKPFDCKMCHRSFFRKEHLENHLCTVASLKGQDG